MNHLQELEIQLEVAERKLKRLEAQHAHGSTNLNLYSSSGAKFSNEQYQLQARGEIRAIKALIEMEKAHLAEAKDR